MLLLILAISYSEYINNIRVLALNNGSKRHKALKSLILILNKVFDETFMITANSKIQTEFTPIFNSFEVQILIAPLFLSG